LATAQYFNFKTQGYFDRFIIVIRIDLNCRFTSLQFIQFPLSFFAIIHCCLIASYFNPYYSCVVADAVRNIAFNPWLFDLVFHCYVNSLPSTLAILLIGFLLSCSIILLAAVIIIIIIDFQFSKFVVCRIPYI